MDKNKSKETIEKTNGGKSEFFEKKSIFSILTRVEKQFREFQDLFKTASKVLIGIVVSFAALGSLLSSLIGGGIQLLAAIELLTTACSMPLGKSSHPGKASALFKRAHLIRSDPPWKVSLLMNSVSNGIHLSLHLKNFLICASYHNLIICIIHIIFRDSTHTWG